MQSDPPPHRSSTASPGHGDRRERLAQFYDGMGDTARQKLLQLAEELSERAGSADAIGKRVVPIRPEPTHWDSDRLYFELQQRSRRILCSVSRQALEQVGPGRGARRWQLVEAFERLRPHIERIAWKRSAAAPGATGVIEILAAELTAELDDGPEPAAPAATLQGSVGE
jgi:Protein of unknown function (DUF1488)